MIKPTLFKPLLCSVALFFSLQAKLQIITTVAGNGEAGYSGDGGLALNATFKGITDVDIDALNNIYITGNNVVRKVNATTGIITTVIGNGTAGFSGDGGLASQAQLYGPYSSALDSFGNIYITDRYNYRIRRVDAITGIITTIAGTGVRGFSGDGGLAINANLGDPLGLTVNAAGTKIPMDVHYQTHLSFKIFPVRKRSGLQKRMHCAEVCLEIFLLIQ